MNQIRRQVASATRRPSLRPGLMAAVVAGAMLTGTAGALLAPPAAVAAEAGSAASSTTTVVRTVAYSTPLEPARPAGVARESAKNPNGGGGESGPDGSGGVECGSAPDGSAVCKFNKQNPSATSAGLSGGAARPVSASTPNSEDEDSPSSNPLFKMIKGFSSGVASVAKDFGAVGDAIGSFTKAAAPVLSFLAPVMTAAAPAIAGALLPMLGI